jgi:AcrR family transcriptional regulator
MSTSKFPTQIRRDQIARAALELIASEGMKKFNVSGLAHRVGFTPSAIYHHFKGKDEILDAVLDLLQRTQEASFRTVHQKSARDLQIGRRNAGTPLPAGDDTNPEPWKLHCSNGEGNRVHWYTSTE